METINCPHCQTPNELTNSTCVNCQKNLKISTLRNRNYYVSDLLTLVLVVMTINNLLNEDFVNDLSFSYAGLLLVLSAIICILGLKRFIPKLKKQIQTIYSGAMAALHIIFFILSIIIFILYLIK